VTGAVRAADEASEAEAEAEAAAAAEEEGRNAAAGRRVFEAVVTGATNGLQVSATVRAAPPCVAWCTRVHRRQPRRRRSTTNSDEHAAGFVAGSVCAQGRRTWRVAQCEMQLYKHDQTERRVASSALCVPHLPQG
jgi:hypothetical protein